MAFKPGQSGNPGGRTKVEKRIRQAWETLVKADGGESAVAEWVGFLRGVMLDATQGTRDRLSAARTLKEAGYGKAKETVVLEGSGEAAATVDWSTVPSEKKQRLLDAILELQGYAGEPPTEH